MRIGYWLFSSFLATVSTVAEAQHPLVLEKLIAWNAAVPMPSAELTRDQVLKAVAAVPKGSGGCLPKSAIIEEVTPATGVRFIFQGILAGTVQNGWTVTARHPDCDGQIARYTMFQNRAGDLSTVRTNQGQSHANESLIGDTWPLALLQVDGTLKRNNIVCDSRSAVLGVTRVATEEPGLGADVYGVRYTGSWTEVWPITLCGRTVEVSIAFTADGDGGAYSDLKGTEAKLLPTPQ